MLHADARWSQEHLEDDKDAVSQALLAAFTAVTGAGVPDFSSLHRWRYARAGGPFEPQTPILWDPNMGLGACGDWMVGEQVESAWISAMAMSRAVLDWLQPAATLRT